MAVHGRRLNTAASSTVEAASSTVEVASSTEDRHRPLYTFIQCGRCCTTFVCSGKMPVVLSPQEGVTTLKSQPHLKQNYSKHCDLCGVYNDRMCEVASSAHRKSRQPFDSYILQLPECCKKKVYRDYMQMWNIVVGTG